MKRLYQGKYVDIVWWSTGPSRWSLPYWYRGAWVVELGRLQIDNLSWVERRAKHGKSTGHTP